jgi:hypothetical protein
MRQDFEKKRAAKRTGTDPRREKSRLKENP